MSKSGPQSQKSDNGSNSISTRGMDPSYIGKIDVISTSSGEPGVSGTVTPFCKIHDPNNKKNFYFADEPSIIDINKYQKEDIDKYEEDILTEIVI